jgi:hypothetical protein
MSTTEELLVLQDVLIVGYPEASEALQVITNYVIHLKMARRGRNM